jgi:hypothetical protein
MWWQQRRARRTSPRLALGALCCAAAVGCKSDLSQQLLERELRYQEDQIYQLQDELQEKCARVDMLDGENASLRRQLGVSPGDAVSRPRAGSPRPSSGPIAVPPAIQIPEAIRTPSPADIPLAPPALDNIPPLPVKPSASPAPAPLALPEPIEGAAAPEPAPVAVPVSYAEQASDGRPVRLAVNLAASVRLDDDGDGVSDGIAITVEPRDASEKLVPAPGAVTITAFDVVDPTTPLASWTLPTEQAAAHFRPTTRLRGLHFPLRWTGVPPTGDHVRVVVRITGAEGAVLETDATIPTR